MNNENNEIFEEQPLLNADEGKNAQKTYSLNTGAGAAMIGTSS